MEILKKIWVKEIYLPITYILIGITIYKIVSKIIKVALDKRQEKLPKNGYNYKRIETFENLIINIIRIVVIAFVILSILPIFGINITSLLAGVGIVSAVVALALQDTLKDFIGGITIILENQFAMGDTITIGGFKGEVIAMGLKSTKLRNFEGEIKIIANRNITEVINHSCDYSVAIVDVCVSYEEDIEKVEKILRNLAEKLSQELTKLKGPVELLGIQDLANSSVNFRMMAKTESLEHFSVQREIRKEVKLCLDKENIKIPYTQIEVHHGN